MSQGASFVGTAKSFATVSSSSNIKFSSYRCKGCEKQHEYIISCVKENTNNF